MTEMLLGSVLVPDIANPRPEDVDVAFMRARLAGMRRFAGHPAALTVADHQRVCGLLARRMRLSGDVAEWAEHHDDHEYATGDIPSPLQQEIGAERLRALQERWDVAICGALGIAVPTARVRRMVSVVDRVALALEWRWRLSRDVAELGLSGFIVGLAERNRAVMVDYL